MLLCATLIECEHLRVDNAEVLNGLKPRYLPDPRREVLLLTIGK